MVREHPQGLITVVGGWPIMHRLMAAEAVDHVARVLSRIDGRPIAAKAATDRESLPGGEGHDLDVLAEDAARDGFASDVAQHLVRSFGSEMPAVTRLAMAEPDLARPVVQGQPVILAELVHAMRREMAITLGDLLMRRTRLFFQAPEAMESQISRIADLAAEEMGWDSERKAAELTAHHADLDQSRVFLHNLDERQG
jgi:glycerol-3-phosphate dehydrogenase